MIYLLGFHSPNADEVPEILYIGMDGVEAERIAAVAPHARLARMVNPVLYPLRHWSEPPVLSSAQAPQPAGAEPLAAPAGDAPPAEPAPAAPAEAVQEDDPAADIATATRKRR